MRKIKFQNEQYYHIFNRGVDQRDIFCNDYDFIRFIYSIREFNNNSGYSQRDFQKRKHEKLSFGYPKLSFFNAPNIVKIIAYCLNKNHYHLLLQQNEDRGIEKFMHKLNLGYTKYFNFRYKRSGSLLEGTYKAVNIKSEEHLLQISCYINGNPEIHKISPAKKWIWSSYLDYLNLRNGSLCDKKIILKNFKNTQEYEKLTNHIIIESQDLKKELKEYMLK